MKRASACLTALAFVSLAGCGLPGTWKSMSLKPEIARNQFRLIAPSNPGVDFTKASLTLSRDGSYAATIHYGEFEVLSSGHWEKEDGKLTLVDDQGISKTYNYALEDSDKTLKLERQIEGTNVTLTLKRSSW